MIVSVKSPVRAALCALALSSVLAVPSAAAFEKDTLTIWIGYEQDPAGLEKVGAVFTEKTGIKVKVGTREKVEYSYHLLGKEADAPDIFIFAHDRYGEWYKAGVVSPLEISDEVRARFPAFAWDAMTVGGVTLGYPISIETLGLLCNDSLIDTPPESLEEFEKLDQDARKNGLHAISWTYSSPYYCYPMITAQGGYVFGRAEDGSVDVKDTGMNNGGARKAMAYLKHLVDTEVLPKDAEVNKINAAFEQGKTLCTINGPWWWSKLDRSGLKYTVYPLPKLGGEQMRGFVGVLGATINPGSPNTEAARDFIENYLETDAGLELYYAGGVSAVPALSSYYEKLSDEPRLFATYEAAMNGEPMPSVPQMHGVWEGFGNAIEAITRGRMSVDEAMEICEQTILNQP